MHPSKHDIQRHEMAHSERRSCSNNCSAANRLPQVQHPDNRQRLSVPRLSKRGNLTLRTVHVFNGGNLFRKVAAAGQRKDTSWNALEGTRSYPAPHVFRARRQ